MRTFFILGISFLLTNLQAQTVVDTIALDEKPNVTLPKELEENSGLEYIDNAIWTFNDSGSKPEIFKINPKTGVILQTIKVENAKNEDWEDITSDTKHIYIGDFGNNSGNRKDLKIYVIKKKDIKPNDSKQKVKAKTISFSYPEQTDYTKQKPLVTDFDCESMVYYAGKLHLFTKEWSSHTTTHYTLDPKIDGQSAKKIENHPIGFCATGATIVQEKDKKQTLSLVGYTQDGLVSMVRFAGITENNPLFFTSNNIQYKKYFLGLSPSIGQIEGITSSENQIFISGEDFSIGGFHVPQKMYFLDKF